MSFVDKFGKFFVHCRISSYGRISFTVFATCFKRATTTVSANFRGDGSAIKDEIICFRRPC